ncbi:MAG: hypothetical protein COS89_03305 [Deltaproteobacteria bacterium CG07_land_8_20_14_0_80_38_7]|nr:MAG: hypothetical protein COS89_03305 [Deltaproteobacteria bacterium CG07_land_8_20_14_0_80_38_7]
MCIQGKYKTLLSSQENCALKVFQEMVKKEAQGKLLNLILFGSKARGESTEDSDVDVLVVISMVDEILKTKIWDIAYQIFKDTDIMISPLVLDDGQYQRLDSHERLIVKSIKKEGIPL